MRLKRQTPEYKARQRKCQTTPEYIEKKRLYDSADIHKARRIFLRQQRQKQ